MTSSQRSDEATALELHKLRHEVAQLTRPFWKDPKVVGSIVAFLVSLALNVSQFLSAREDSLRKDQELALKLDQWKLQQQQLELELRRTRQQLEVQKAKTETSQADTEELAQVKESIALWETAIANSQLQMATMRNNIPRFEQEGRKHRAEAERANMELQEGLLRMQQAELQKSMVRRSELEARLK